MVNGIILFVGVVELTPRPILLEYLIIHHIASWLHSVQVYLVVLSDHVIVFSLAIALYLSIAFRILLSLIILVVIVFSRVFFLLVTDIFNPIEPKWPVGLLLSVHEITGLPLVRPLT